MESHIHFSYLINKMSLQNYLSIAAIYFGNKRHHVLTFKVAGKKTLTHYTFFTVSNVTVGDFLRDK